MDGMIVKITNNPRDLKDDKFCKDKFYLNFWSAMGPTRTMFLIGRIL